MVQRPAVQVSEVAKPDGIYAMIQVRYSATEIFYCSIRPVVNDDVDLKHMAYYQRKTRAHGNGSVRYDSHKTYPEALAAGLAWANRKALEIERGDA